MPVRASEVPKAVRERAETLVAGEAPRPGKPAPTPADGAPLYRCAACGEEFRWTAQATPRAIETHRDATGHGRFEMVLR